MKTLVCTEPGLLEYAEQPSPVYAAGNTILRIRRSVYAALIYMLLKAHNLISVIQEYWGMNWRLKL